MRLFALAVPGALALAGCASTWPEGSESPQDSCRAAPGQSFIGQRASRETGAAIMKATGSTRLRWVPPDTIVTTEYAFGRVTISYDANFSILEVICG